MNNTVDLLVLYRIIRRLTTAFEDTPAFENELIDADGNLLKKRSDMTPAEKKQVTLFDLFIFNMKKLLGKLPGGKTKFGTFAAAMFLLREETKLNTLEEDFEDFINDDREQRLITEMVVTGADTATDAPVVQARKKAKRTKFAGRDVFVVDEDTFNNCRVIKSKSARFSKFVEDADYLEDVRDYARANPSKTIVVQSERTGAMFILKKGSKD